MTRPTTAWSLLMAQQRRIHRLGWRIAVGGCAALSALSLSPECGEAQWRLATMPRVGAFVPTTTLGPWLTASARTGPGVTLGVTSEAVRRERIGLRVELDAALGAGPHVQSDDCSRSCGRENTYAGAVVLAVGDVSVPLHSGARARLDLIFGGGMKAYLFPATGGSCAPTDDICAATLQFTRSRADRTVHAAASLRRRAGRRHVVLELGDYVSRYDGGRVQHDLLVTVGLRGRAP